MELREYTPQALVNRGEELLRTGRTGAAIAKVYLGYKGLDLIDRGPLHPLVRAARKRWHAASARTLHDTALDLGGLLLKAGQFVGTRADILPRAYVEQLARLQDRVPAHPYSVVSQVIEEELGARPEQIFSRIWRRPIAAASLAQVHRATLPDGREVAVKVQRPEIPHSLSTDLRNLRVALETIELIEGPLGLRLLLDEIENTLPRELDFEAEAQSAFRMEALLRQDASVLIPRPVLELSRRRILVAEYVPGLKITSRGRLKAAGLDPADVAHLLLKTYAQQIFEHGFFHADPHPGNLLVIPQPENSEIPFRIAFLDFGLVQEVPEDFRAGLLALLAGVMSQDADAIARALGSLGLEAREHSTDTLQSAAELAVESMRRQRAGDTQAGYRDIGHALLELLRSNPLIGVPSHIVLIARVLGLISGIARTLGVKLELSKELLPYLMSAK